MKELKDKIPSINMLLLAFEEWRVKTCYFGRRGTNNDQSPEDKTLPGGRLYWRRR